MTGSARSDMDTKLLAWWRGENTAAGIHAGVKWFVARSREYPERMDDLFAAGSWDVRARAEGCCHPEALQRSGRF